MTPITTDRPTTRAITWHGMLVEVRGYFTSARPAPRCSNPDRASFADQGEPAEADLTEAFFLHPSNNEHDRIPLTEDMLRHMQEDVELTRVLGLV